PAFNRYFTGLAVFTAVSITFQLFLKYSIAVQIQVALSLLTLGSVVTVGSVGVFRKSRPARYFMGSWLIILFGGIIYAFKVLAVLPTNTFTTYALQIGSVIQFILLALGLGDRINVIKMEKDRAQQDAIRSQQMAIENLSKADRLKDEFLANTSHELKTPLVGIIGMAESLIDGAAGPMTAEMKYNLSMISSSGLRLSSLINDILDYSKMKNSTLELRRRPVDLHQLADLVFVMARTLLRGKLIELKNDVPEGLPLVFADENRLQQIFFNLVGNAIKFTDRGHVRITAAARDLHAGTHMVEVRVEDTGIGIPHNRQGDIFRSFEQVDASISREYGGTGLGLSITKKLIELHNGGIWVESEPGKGSSFIFTIPVSENQSTIPADTAGGEVKAIALQELPPLPAISGEGSARILVVDDELINLQVLSNQLLLEKHRVILATNGEDAIKLIAENPPDMVVLDIMMPCMSGLEVCRRLRETYSLHELPVLMLTAKNQLNDIIAGFEAGANDYLAKPFDKRELIARVNTLLSLRDAIEKNNSLLVMQKELEIAKRILQSILPDGPPVMKKLAIYTRYLPMDRVGGDFFDFHVLDEDRIGVFTADVSGHGVPSAIIAAMLKVAFSLQKSIAREPDELLREINHILRGKFGKSFITAIYAYIDMVAGTLSGSNAGHFPIVIHRKQDGTIHEFMPKGWAIGIRGEPMLTREEFALAAGDRIVLFTDGIIEARNKAGDLFGYETFLGHIGTQRHLPPREFADFIIARMSEWTGQGDRFDDDVTLLVIDVADDYVKAG
ncbi:MAG TPA: SpoIIE family protein phosphatase, partial [Spirochaetota bacterium]|nr:SpoIIE family protein phosphatase [Spirochaetota bacterium]